MADGNLANGNPGFSCPEDPVPGNAVQLPELPPVVLSTDSPRKRIVRECWDTPVLQAIHKEFGIDYTYCGLPGPQVIDIRLWQPMVSRVIAFQAEDEDESDPRQTLVALNMNLQKMGYPGEVYCGYMDNVILLGKDLDGKQYQHSQFITLFNFDFCDTITSRVLTPEGRQCQRFYALLDVMNGQRRLSNEQDNRFILLLTVREEFHRYQMDRFMRRPDLPNATKQYLQRLPRASRADRDMDRSAPHLKAFVFTTLREYGQVNFTSTFFLPMVRYVGRTRRSNMLHFVVLCRCYTVDTYPGETQTPGMFLNRSSVRATDNEILLDSCGVWETNISQVSIVDTSLRFLR